MAIKIRKGNFMKITRTARDSLSATQRRAQANFGCQVCPCCGEGKLNWNISKKAFTTKECLEVLYASTGQRDCLTFVICGMIVIPAIHAAPSGKVRHMKTHE